MNGSLIQAQVAIDFTVYVHPVLAVKCPNCHATPGVWCHRPSEHTATELHKLRLNFADTLFIEQHGEMASIENTDSGWFINPQGRINNVGQIDLTLD